MRLDVDVREVLALAGDLRDAAAGLLGRAKPVVAGSAADVKKAMQDDMRGSKHFGQVAPSITYSTRQGRDWVESEIGPLTQGEVVGDLAHFAYFGGAHGGGGTVRDPADAANEEAPRFERGIVQIVEDML